MGDSMRRALGIFLVVALTALVTWLATTRYLAEQRAVWLERQLSDAQTRVAQLDEELDAAQQRVAALAREQPSVHPPRTPPRRTTPAPSPAPAPSLPSSDTLMVLSESDRGASAPPSVTQVLAPQLNFTSVRGDRNIARIEGTSNIHDWQA